MKGVQPATHRRGQAVAAATRRLAGGVGTSESFGRFVTLVGGAHRDLPI